MRCLLCCLLLGLIWTPSANSAEFYAAPQGGAQGDGSAAKPWDLATAVSGTRDIQPGDTLWLQPGTYRGGFESRLKGLPERPIVVRGQRNGRVTLDLNPGDGSDRKFYLQLLGADTIYRDFEVSCSHTQRETKIPGPWPADIVRGGVEIHGDRISAIHLIVHDLAGGFGFWSEGEGGEITGCVIYNNGWRGPDRGHGHAIYAQNARGTKRIRDNILFHQFGYGIHVYGSEKASLKGFDITGNIAFENGCLAGNNEHSPGIMVGGASPAERIAVRDNVVVGGGIRLGYPWGATSEDVECTGNYADWGLVLRDFRKATVERNTIVAHSTVISLEGAGELLKAGQKWDRNAYFLLDGKWGDCSVVEHGKSRGLTFAEWQTTTGFDAESTFTRGGPSRLKIVVRPSAVEAGRAQIAVLNPERLPEVKLDVSEILQPEQSFRIVSAKDYFGPPVASGRYQGEPIMLPMGPVTPPAPVGLPNVKLPTTEPEFGAFVLLADD